MQIAVIGVGKIGGAIAGHMSRAGHEVKVASSRGPEALADRAAELGATAATVEDAVRDADLVFLAVPYDAVDQTVAAGGSWDGKIVVDVTNYYPGRDGEELDPGDQSSSALVASKLPGARVVKAFNTIMWKRLESEPGLAIFYATDDDAAGETVAGLIRAAGFAPVRTGGLSDGGKRQEPDSAIYNVPMSEDEARAAVGAA